MTTFHTFDNPPPPSDIELEMLDRRRRERKIPGWLCEAIIQAQDERDEKETQQDATGVLF